MSRIKGKHTKPEILLRKFLWSNKIRYKLHQKLPGKPDIVIPYAGTIIFVHGCFWHWHGCNNSVMPKTNTDFWADKIEGNITRDLRNITALQDMGWRVFVIWECGIEKNVADAAYYALRYIQHAREIYRTAGRRNANSLQDAVQ